MTEETTIGLFNRLWAIAEDRAYRAWIHSVQEAFITMRDVEMDGYYEMPADDFERLKTAILSAPDKSAEYKKLLEAMVASEVEDE